jgi:hypothetical protein
MPQVQIKQVSLYYETVGAGLIPAPLLGRFYLLKSLNPLPSLASFSNRAAGFQTSPSFF